MKAGWPSKALGAISTLVFHHTVVFLLLTRRCGGENITNTFQNLNAELLTCAHPCCQLLSRALIIHCVVYRLSVASGQTLDWRSQPI